MAYAVDTLVRTEQQESAFEQLFLREYSRVAGIAFRVLGDRDEAEDVAQEVFYALYRRHAPDAPYAAPWLYQAAAHTALNVVRGKRRRTRRETVVEEHRSRVEDSVDPQQAVVADEQRQEVRAALGRLPEKSATVLVLRYSGLSYADVAAAIGVKTGQVGTLLRRAEAALRKEMTHGTH